MNSSHSPSRRSAGQWIVIVIFGLLSLAFFFRLIQFGLKWARHVVEGDANFKALTLWALVYVIASAAIAAGAYFMSSGDDDLTIEKENAEVK